MSASGAELQRTARDVAEGLPGVTVGHPFTPHLQVFKVAGHVFLIVTEDPDEQIITVKAEVSRAEALIREHESIQHGRYLDKRHWLSVGAGRAVTTSLVQDLVQDSYDLVRAQLSARERGQLGGE